MCKASVSTVVFTGRWVLVVLREEVAHGGPHWRCSGLCYVLGWVQSEVVLTQYVLSVLLQLAGVVIYFCNALTRAMISFTSS